jgi:hypothetical protein
LAAVALAVALATIMGQVDQGQAHSVQPPQAVDSVGVVILITALVVDLAAAAVLAVNSMWVVSEPQDKVLLVEQIMVLAHLQVVVVVVLAQLDKLVVTLG